MKINQRLLKKEFDQIEKCGGATIFWVTETNARAKRIMYLEKIGAIVRETDNPRDAYPNMVYSTDKSKLPFS